MKYKKIIIKIILITLCLFISVAITAAWLKRTGTEIPTSGFSVHETGTIIDQVCKVQTMFQDVRGNWKTIGIGINKESDVGDFSDGLISITSGKRTEFITRVTNITNSPIVFSAYLKDMQWNESVADYITLKTYEPEEYAYSKDHVNDGNLLKMAEEYEIGPKASVEIKWFLYLDQLFNSESFLVLADENENPISNELEGPLGIYKYYYCVVEYNGGTGKIYKAYRVNEQGCFIDKDGYTSLQRTSMTEKDLVEYSITENESYENKKYTYIEPGVPEYCVRINGMYVTAQRKTA